MADKNSENIMKYRAQDIRDLKDCQAEVHPGYSAMSYAGERMEIIEDQSLHFLESYFNNDIILENDDALPELAAFFEVLKKSTHREIKSILKKHSKEVEEIAKHLVIEEKKAPTPVKEVYSTGTLKTIIAAQQSVNPGYSMNSYFGENMRVMEDQTADFLEKYAEGKYDVRKEDEELLSVLFTISRSSEYSRLKSCLKKAKKRYKQEHETEYEEEENTPKATPQVSATKKESSKTISNEELTGKNFSILHNKKKMKTLSSTQFLTLSAALNEETSFSTRKLKEKLRNFANNKISAVLKGEEVEDKDFGKLVLAYGTPTQKEKYKKGVSKKTMNKQTEQSSFSSKKEKTKKKNGFFKSVKKFFNKAKETASEIFEEIRKPLVVGGIFALTLFAGKKAYDFIEEDSMLQYASYNYVPQDNINEDIVSENDIDEDTHIDKIWAKAEAKRDSSEYAKADPLRPDVIAGTSTTNNDTKASSSKKEETKKENTKKNNSPAVASSTENKNDAPTVATTPMSPKQKALENTISRLKKLKNSNPSDRNMDVLKTANELHKNFGENSDKVVLACAMAPYALNDSLHLNLGQGKRATTHNMVEYLSTHKLSNTEKTALNNFINTHIKNNSIDMSKFKSYSVSNLKQLRNLKAKINI